MIHQEYLRIINKIQIKKIVITFNSKDRKDLLIY